MTKKQSERSSTRPADPLNPSRNLSKEPEPPVATRAHQHGLTIYVGTLAPFEGVAFGYYSEERNAARKDINEWIRNGKDFDGHFDFDHALADPAPPNRLSPTFDSGDHIHPNDAGEQALAEAVDTSFFY